MRIDAEFKKIVVASVVASFVTAALLTGIQWVSKKAGVGFVS